jgi:radical SAM protein with 4Fe4S-binding SPASM domain
MERKLVEVAWEITDDCNFNCIHCYNPRNRQDLDYDKIIEVLEQLRVMGVEKVKYGGGEPLVRVDFLKILERTIEMGFDTTFSTNGYVVDSGLVRDIGDTGLNRIQVSLDGNEQVHNLVRNNSQAYVRAVNAIARFVEQGFKVSVATTLIKPNLNCLEDIFNCCSSLGVNRWRVMKYIPSCRFDLAPNSIEYWQAHKKLLELRNKSPKMEVYVAREFNEICEQKDRFDSECFGGRTVASIRANGDVSPCSYFPNLVIGNLKAQTMQELWNSPRMLEFASEVYGDSDCPFFKNCQGGCKAVSFYINGRGGCDPYCWIKFKERK